MNVKFKRLLETAILPTRGSEYAGGYDLAIPLNQDPIRIAPGQTSKIDLGFSLEFPNEVYYIDNVQTHSGKSSWDGSPKSWNTFHSTKLGLLLQIQSRSGWAKKGLVVAQGTGIVDSDYRGSICVLLRNESVVPFDIQAGERIAQAILTPYFEMNIEEVDELSNTQRGSGGFGSTDSPLVENIS